MIEYELHTRCGIDLDDRELLRARTWRWLKVRIRGLITDPDTLLHQVLFPTNVDQEVKRWRSS